MKKCYLKKKTKQKASFKKNKLTQFQQDHAKK